MFLFIICVAGFIPFVSLESCYRELCLSCKPDNVQRSATIVECHPSNWVSAEWVHSIGHRPPSTESRVPIEYRCLKMVATPDDKSFGNTIDVIKGCVPRAQVDSVCLSLEAVERARGHSDARCFTCRGNNCNSASKGLTSFGFVFLIAFLFHVYRLSR